MTDDNGESFDLSIPAIDAAADDHLKARKKEADGKIKLHEAVNNAYTALDEEMAKHLDELPASGVYTYTAYDNKRKQVAYGKRKITIRNAKAAKGKVKGDVIPNAVNPDQGAELPELEEKAAE